MDVISTDMSTFRKRNETAGNDCRPWVTYRHQFRFPWDTPVFPRERLLDGTHHHVDRHCASNR